MCLALQSTCNFKPVPLSTVKYVVVKVGRIPFLKSLTEIRLMKSPWWQWKDLNPSISSVKAKMIKNVLNSSISPKL